MSNEEKDEKTLSLPAFGLADDILASLEKEVAEKSSQASEKTVAETITDLSLSPLDAKSPSRIIEFASLVEDFSLRRENQQREEEIQAVAFCLAGEEYALQIEHVQEIVRVSTFTRVPEAPEHVRGVMNLRGKILPVVELRTRLGMAALDITHDSRIVVVEAYAKTIGLLVDFVTQIVKVPTSALSPPPEEVMPPVADYLSAVIDMDSKLVLLLDTEKVLLLPKRA